MKGEYSGGKHGTRRSARSVRSRRDRVCPPKDVLIPPRPVAARAVVRDFQLALDLARVGARFFGFRLRVFGGALFGFLHGVFPPFAGSFPDFAGTHTQKNAPAAKQYGMIVLGQSLPLYFAVSGLFCL